MPSDVTTPTPSESSSTKNPSREEEGEGRGVDEDDDDESGVNRMFEFGVAQVSGSFDVKRDVFRGARGRWGGGGVMLGLHSAGKKDGKKE